MLPGVYIPNGEITGSGNGLLPDGTKPLPEPILTNHQQGVTAFIWGQLILQEMLQMYIIDITLKMTNSKLHYHFLGANELKM